MPTRRIPAALWYLIAAAGLLYLIFIWRTSFDVGGQRHFTLVDDAMVSMRYSRNLVRGYGLVWNPGEAPVQGFTNPGWLLVMAIVHLLPLSVANISLVVMLIAALMLVLNVIVVFWLVKQLDDNLQLAPWIAAGMTAFYFPLVFWSLRGLEVGALTLAMNTALLLTLRLAESFRQVGGSKQMTRSKGSTEPGAAIRQSALLGLVLASALLVRLDSALQAVLLLGFLIFSARAATGARASAAARPSASVGIPVIIAALALGGLLFFQQSYFGDLLPNTYYLKINGVTLWERVRTGLVSLNDYATRDFMMPLAIAIIGLAAFREIRTPAAALLLGLFAVQIAYSVWVGGDYAEELVDAANRFIAQGLPPLFILFAIVMETMLRRSREFRPQPGLGLAIGLAAILVVSGEPWGKWALSNAPMLRTDIQRVKLGLHIAAHTDPAAVIAVHAAGQIPYYSDRTTIDLLGKNDPFIAKGPPATAFAPGHNKWNYEYSILEHRPDVIADNFHRFASFIESVPAYTRLPNGIFVRADSPFVDVDALGADY